MSRQARSRALSEARRRGRVEDQQAVIDRLRAGNPIQGARSANPFAAALQGLMGNPANQAPDLYPAQLGGRNALVGKGGFNQAAAAGPINVGGQTFYPLQRGEDVIYQASTETTPQNSFLSPRGGRDIDTPIEPARDELPALNTLEERAYQSEASRQAQQAASDPYFQQNELYRKAREQLNLEGDEGADNREAVEDLGMAIYRSKYGDPNTSSPNPLMAGFAQTGQNRGGATFGRDQDSRDTAMNLAAQTVNALLNPEENKALNAGMFTPSQSQAVRGQAGFNTSATFDLGSVGPAITDMQPNLNPMSANRSGEEGFKFDANILDEKKRALFAQMAGLDNPSIQLRPGI